MTGHGLRVMNISVGTRGFVLVSFIVAYRIRRSSIPRQKNALPTLYQTGIKRANAAARERKSQTDINPDRAADGRDSNAENIERPNS